MILIHESKRAGSLCRLPRGPDALEAARRVVDDGAGRGVAERVGHDESQLLLQVLLVRNESSVHEACGVLRSRNTRPKSPDTRRTSRV